MKKIPSHDDKLSMIMTLLGCCARIIKFISEWAKDDFNICKALKSMYEEIKGVKHESNKWI